MKILKMIKEDNNRYWEAFIEPIYTPQQADIIIYHGIKDGKLTRRQKHVTEKNIGRSNYTDAPTQAWKEILALGRAKLDEGYSVINTEVITEEDNFISNKLIYPMLAVGFEKVKDKLLKERGLYLQPKLDGVRCLAYLNQYGDVILQTRNGKYFEILEHINNEIKYVLKPNYIFDGEIYVHGWSFQRIVSAVKKKSDDTAQLQYHIYDMTNNELSFCGRYEMYCNILKSLHNNPNSKIKIVHSHLISNNFEAAIMQYMQEKTSAGYEGIMIRTIACPYRFDKRSNELVKYKEFQDKEYVITDGCAEPLQNGYKGIVYAVRDPDDMSKCAFGVRPKGTMEERMIMFNNLQQDIGKKITVRFQGFTDDGYPRFPVGVGIRDYE